ncbi:hypothetical protein [Clostridium guangxiense]|uniref:hypothetical protein n=1 Tax=Clostridium guangxiense TaxID=1662055 RepID=UPI001E28DC79|nr:hypothetical protein [Clostridium guangxiense]MCD2348246.1 hypothetical protein [Clostridium guangxiense]
MSEKLLVAKYKDDFIQYSEYQEKIHKGKLYCPFCNPPIRVTYTVKGFFRAWPNEGRHNCGVVREQVKYLQKDWKGRKITEIARNQDDELEVTVDINTLIYPQIKNSTYERDSINNYYDNKGCDIFLTDKDREEVFRDVVKSVYQMKRILEKNDQEVLKKIKFRFKTNNEIISLNDAVIKIHELKNNVIGKSRFIIFKVANIVPQNKVIYVNSYSLNGINLTAKLDYPYNKNPFRLLKDEYAIAYGRITYSEKYNKYFLTLTNDFQIKKLKKDVGDEFFDGVDFEKYYYKKIVKTKEIKRFTKSNTIECTENQEEVVLNKRFINNNIKSESQVYCEEKNTLNSNIEEIQANKNKMKKEENITISNKNKNLVIENSKGKLGNVFSGVKRFFQKFLGKH